MNDPIDPIPDHASEAEILVLSRLRLMALQIEAQSIVAQFYLWLKKKAMESLQKEEDPDKQSVELAEIGEKLTALAILSKDLIKPDSDSGRSHQMFYAAWQNMMASGEGNSPRLKFAMTRRREANVQIEGTVTDFLEGVSILLPEDHPLHEKVESLLAGLNLPEEPDLIQRKPPSLPPSGTGT